MKKLVLGLVLTFATVAFANDSKYYEVKNVKTQLVASEQLMTVSGVVSAECDNSVGPANPFEKSGNPLDDAGTFLDQIINIGKKIWSIVEAGKPVMNIKTDVATALPKGVKCWLDLDGWQAPESHTYRVTVENGYSSEVVNFEYRVIYVYGGSVRGVGKYIGYATMQPVSTYVAWGWSLTAQGSVPTVYNMGTHENPKGGMTMTMDYHIDTPLAAIRESQSYFVGGNGEFKKLD